MNRKSTLIPLFLLLVLVSLLWVSFAAAQAPAGREYVVQADDWLSKLAEKEYGDPLAYPSIVEATNAKADEDDSFAIIDNPDIIEIGQKVWLPATLEGSGEAMASEEMVAESEALEPVFAEFDPNNFSDSANIDNQWLPLKPGTHWAFEGETVEEGESIPHRIEFTVTDLTKEIAGVSTIVAWIEDINDDQVVEKEIAFYAQDNDGNVWYLGEHPEEYEDGEFVDAPTWLPGFEDAKAGIQMQAEPQPGTAYFQGWAPAVEWSDYSQVDQLGQETCVPVDCYEDVLVVAEANLEEPGAFQLKYYAPGVGNVRVGWRGDDATQEELELVEFMQLDKEALAEVRAEALALEEHAYEVSPDVYALTTPAEPLAAE